MKINMNKTEILMCSKETEEVNIHIKDIPIKQTKTFKYLGSCITEDGKSTSDVRQRIGQAKAAFHKKKTLFCSNNMNIELRKQLIKSLVWKVRWTERISNERVLEMVNEVRQIWKVVQQRRHKWMGHVYRHNDFVVNIIEGRRAGAQGRGIPRMAFIN
uniref:Reverse transcriptase n=1 Tax=Cacopsylla melanoneura TaxID=428564 RepID=A0A8D8SS06_9HEMI